MKERNNSKVLDEEGFKKETLKGVSYEGGETRGKERVLLKGNVEEKFNKEYLQEVLKE